jgi:membrane protein involved in D-alanine export
MGLFVYTQKGSIISMVDLPTTEIIEPIIVALLPLIIVKVTPAVLGVDSLLGFLGISYLTFRSVAMIMELRDGELKTVTFWSFFRFMI